MACASSDPSKCDKATPVHLTCAICLEAYKSPRYLACLHTFCEGCIQSHILQTAEKGAPTGMIQCPLCRTDTVSPCPSEPRKDWARRLPLNQAILQQVLETAETDSHPDCENCRAQGKQSAATSFCKDCKQYQCAECVAMHSKVAFISGHTVVNIADMTPETLQTFSLGKLEFCKEHPDKEIEFYCEEENVLCCINCAFSKHRQCKTVSEVKTLGQTLKDGERSVQLQAEMGELQTRLGEICSVLEDSTSELEKQAEDIPRKMVKLRDEVVKIMDQLVTKVTSECDQLKKQHTTELEDKVTSIKSLEAAITTARSQLEFLMKHGTDTQIFIVIHKLEEQVSRYSTQVTEVRENSSTVDLQLTLSDDLNRILQSADRFTARVTAEVTRIKSSQTPIADCKIEVLPAIDIQERHGQQPRYRGLTCLPDGRLVAVDFDNSRCCLLDENCSVISDIKLPTRPADVAAVGPTEVVVALPDSKQLQRVRIEGTTLTLTETVPCSRKPYSVSRVSDTELFVGWDTGMGIIGLDGTERMYVDKDNTGRVIRFGWDDYVAVDVDKRRVCCSSHSNRTVYCLDYTGQVHFSYSNNLHCPCGLALDRDHNLYVCSWNTHTVHQVSPDGQKIREINPGISWPYTICFNPAGDTLTVMNMTGYPFKATKASKVKFVSPN